MICTSWPRSFSQQLHVVVAGHAQRRARLRPCCGRAARVSRIARAAVHQVADEDRLAALGMGVDRVRQSGNSPSGWSTICVAQLARAAASSSSQQPWTSPMMSNGPCSSRAVVPQRHALDRRRLDLLGTSSTKTCRKPSLAQAAERRGAVATAGCGSTCGPKSRSGRPRFRSWQSRSGRLSTMATGRQWYLRASSTSGLRGLGLHVGGVDDRQPADGQPLGGDVVQHLEGVVGDAPGCSRRR